MKFNLRDVFWLPLVVALVLGWWIDHRNQHRIQVHWKGVAASLEAYQFIFKSTGASWDDKTLTVYPGHNGPEMNFDLREYATKYTDQ